MKDSEMNKERLKEIKANSKSANTYMKKLSKQYLHGKNLDDKEKFIHNIKESHTLDALTNLYNEMKFDKESRTEYYRGFFAILIPFFIAIFSFFGILVGSLYTHINTLRGKAMDRVPENNGSFAELNNLYSEISDMLIKTIGTSILFALITILIMYLIIHTISSKRIQYLSWLSTAKEIKEEEDMIIKLRNLK